MKIKIWPASIIIPVSNDKNWPMNLPLMINTVILLLVVYNLKPHHLSLQLESVVIDN